MKIATDYVHINFHNFFYLCRPKIHLHIKLELASNLYDGLENFVKGFDEKFKEVQIFHTVKQHI